MVPVELGVYRAIVCSVSLVSVISLIMPVPMALSTSVWLSLSSYVVIGMGCGRVRYSHRMLRLLVALQLAPVSPCIALCPVAIVVIVVGVDPFSFWFMTMLLMCVSPIMDIGMVFHVMGLGSVELL